MDPLEASLIKATAFKLPKLEPHLFLFFSLQHFFMFHEKVQGTKVKSYGPAKRFSFTHHDRSYSALGGFIGAPLATIIVENAMVSGGKFFHAFGTAGWLGSASENIGSVQVPALGFDETGMISDYCGLKSSTTFAQTASQKTDLSVVSVNSFYRLTLSNLKRYQGQQISLIDMEAAPLNYIITQNRAHFYPTFVISDFIDREQQWRNEFRSQAFSEGLQRGLDQLLSQAEALTDTPPA